MIDLWQYWEGPMPDWILVGIHSVQKSCGPSVRHHLVTPDNLHQFLDPSDIPADLDRLKQPAHRADFYRAALLAKHGGFYFDADTIGIRSPIDLASQTDLLYTVWDKEPRRVLNGYIYAQPGSPVAAEWAHEARRVVRFHLQGKKVAWNRMGEGILTPLVDKYRDSTTRVNRDTFLPIDVDAAPGNLFQTLSVESVIKPNTVCFGMNHSWMAARRPKELSLDRSRWGTCRCLFHRALERYAHGD